MKTTYSFTNKVNANKTRQLLDLSLARINAAYHSGLKDLNYEDNQELECCIDMYDAILDILADREKTKTTNFYDKLSNQLNKFMSKFKILKMFKYDSLFDNNYDLERYMHDDILVTKAQGYNVYNKFKHIGSEKIIKYIDHNIKDQYKFFAFVLILAYMIYFEMIKDAKTETASVNKIVYQIYEELN